MAITAQKNGILIIGGSQEHLADTAAALIYKTIKNVLLTSEKAVVAVPGGRSVAAIFRSLTTYDLPWHQVHLFLLDERLVPCDDPQSNYRLLHEQMGNILPEENLYPFMFDRQNVEGSLAQYDKKLLEVGGSFDLVLASSGEDGHIGSLFPDHPSIDSKQHGYVLVNDAPKLPPQRISASASLIRQSRAGIILFFGEGKRNAMGRFFDSRLSPRACPAKILAELPCYYLLTDQEVDTS